MSFFVTLEKLNSRTSQEKLDLNMQLGYVKLHSQEKKTNKHIKLKIKTVNCPKYRKCNNPAKQMAASCISPEVDTEVQWCWTLRIVNNSHCCWPSSSYVCSRLEKVASHFHITDHITMEMLKSTLELCSLFTVPLSVAMVSEVNYMLAYIIWGHIYRS